MGIVADNIVEIRRMYDNGVTVTEISKKFRCHKSAIKKYFDTNNIQYNTKECLRPKNFASNKKDEIIKLFNQGMKAKDIAKRLSLSLYPVVNLLNKNKLSSKSNRVIKIDESYFEKIDTSNKAYVLGMMYSDGCVRKSGQCTISLQDGDRHILEDIALDMKYEGKIRFEKRRKINHKDKAVYSFSRQKMRDDLMKLGCVTKKSLVIKFPSIDQVPEKFIPSFLRGVFDGDGSISVENTALREISITSTESFCRDLIIYLNTNNISTSSFRRRFKNKPTGSLKICQITEAKKFLNLIYSDITCSLRLSRKYEKAKPFLLPELQSF